MGVRHAREYADILKDLTDAVSGINRSYTFFEMEKGEWEALADAEKSEVMEALADDVFFGLGEETSIAVGDGIVTYHPKRHVIEVTQGDNVSHVVRLI
ncbi:hypothetical protein [Paenibacillus protaetiae]|uniref:Uncharacterized protein n=1 Tax=Paenibacillus protaetiae TaxID=2509456 RepID=A0A4P6F2Q9_9BACL|nr:hypothetical protein [Paenibacillus protaetiae]QAY67377.1 hypothetical protein ET464_14225 [Paenibacillus protaetiae]